jgi:3-oxoacyl-[acyl-carrier-protein] synthase-3
MDKTTRGRDVTVLFGDGAGAVIMRRRELLDARKDSHVFSTHLYAEGSNAKELWTPGPGSGIGDAERLGRKVMEENLHYPYMNGKKVFANAVRRMPEALAVALKENELSIDEIDLFIFHQANLRINQMIADEMKIPPEKVFNTIQKYGNTTAATIPIGLAEAVKAGKLKKGMLVASAAFGSGFTWASAIYRW